MGPTVVAMRTKEQAPKCCPPAANARTDLKVYVDCHGDYRISVTIYTNRKSASRDFLFMEGILSTKTLSIPLDNLCQVKLILY